MNWDSILAVSYGYRKGIILLLSADDVLWVRNTGAWTRCIDPHARRSPWKRATLPTDYLSAVV